MSALPKVLDLDDQEVRLFGETADDVPYIEAICGDKGEVLLDWSGIVALTAYEAHIDRDVFALVLGHRYALRLIQEGFLSFQDFENAIAHEGCVQLNVRIWLDSSESLRGIPTALIIVKKDLDENGNEPEDNHSLLLFCGDGELTGNDVRDHKILNAFVENLIKQHGPTGFASEMPEV